MSATCIGCGHAQNRHVNGQGLCLVASCTLCLAFRSVSEPAKGEAAA